MKHFFLTLSLFLALLVPVAAQTKQENTGWLMLVNNTKFNEKWGMALDIQLRSADQADYLKNFMFRPGLTYFIDAKSNVTLGYLLNQTYLRQNTLGTSPSVDQHLNEHRIWEQYILTHKINTVFAAHRFRLEQRFIGQANGDEVFAQRFRYFFRLIQPLQKKQATFSKGAFVALQNELFFNIQNQKALNNGLFDQNRAYLAAGYRFSKPLDLELGYLNQFSNGRVHNNMNHVLQLAIYTRF